MVARQQKLYDPYAYGSLQRRHMSVSNRWWRDWLLSSLCQITPKKRSKLHFSGPWRAESGGFPHKGPLMPPWSVFASQPHYQELTHWGRVTHICVNTQTIVGPDNGLSPGRHQAIIWTSAGILLVGPLGANFNEIAIEIDPFIFKKIHLKMSSGIWRPFCLGLSVLSTTPLGGKHGSIQWSINLNWTYLWMHLFAKQSIEKREICIDRQIAACRYWGLSVWLMLWNANQDL